MLFLVHVEKVLLVATLFPEGSPQQMDPQMDVLAKILNWMSLLTEHFRLILAWDWH